LIEGSFRSDKFNPNALLPVRVNDGFEEEIKGFSKEFSAGTSRLGARAAMYLKGKVRGEYLLTLAYDSSKEKNKALFDSIDPNAFYPVYGDSSLKTHDAQSTGKLFVRIDKNRSYLLWGDYTTQDSNPARQLSQYQRTLPGAKAHFEEGPVTVNAFAAQQSFKQYVDEFPARGVSGPYSVSNPNGIKGTERVEILVRKRDQNAVVLKSTALSRDSDYEFEPFNGKILFRSPVPSFDDQLNPVSIRVTYEVDQGGKRYMTYGADLKAAVSENVTVGVSVVRDANPANDQTLSGVNLAVKLNANTEVIAEAAKSKSVIDPVLNGNQAVPTANSPSGGAARIELRHASEAVRAHAYVQRTDSGFSNPSSPVAAGKQEAGAAIAVKATEAITLSADLKRSEDKIHVSQDNSASVALDVKVNNAITVGVGMRAVEQNAAALAQQVNSNCAGAVSSIYTGTVQGYNTGYGISPSGNQQIDPATGLPVICATNQTTPGAAAQTLDRTAAFARVAIKATDNLTVDGEVQNIKGTDAGRSVKLGARLVVTEGVDLTAQAQREIGGDSSNDLYRLGADWKVAEKTRIYSRYEQSHTYSANYGLGIGPLQRVFALGIDTQYMQDGTLYNEYRLNDAASGKNVQNAIGLRNGWMIAQGLRLQTSAERIVSTAGDSNALSLGLEYTASDLWKGSTRIQRRDDSLNTNWLFTANAVTKLNRDWSLLAREYLNLVEPKNNTQDTKQNRFQIGFAFRPVDHNKFDALGLVETKSDQAPGIDSETTIVSLRANYHPSRPWWISGRLASKQVNELLAGTVKDSYRASLAGARVTYDVSNRWSVGAISTMLMVKGGARQFAYGVEIGYTLADNMTVGLGYNWRGFRDDDLTGSDYTNRGWLLNLRYKFDEDLFR
jgi:hypothetical protein